ncbi:hypothetical protein T484DRAFT_1755027 [Baffinella frigidus]|nr:hypothetical protein T484DRAFT_1755027 [Cryptophyta sp. CCMP2293]
MPRKGTLQRVLLPNINHSMDQTVHELETDQWTLLDASSGRVVNTGPLSHDNVISSLTFSMDGSLFVTGDCLGHVKIWDTLTGDLVRCMEHKPLESTDWRFPLSISSDATRIAGVSRNWGDNVVIWNTSTGGIVHEMSASLEHLRGIDTCEFSPTDPHCLAIVSSKNGYDSTGIGDLWDIENMAQMVDDNAYKHTFEGRNFLKFSPNGEKMVTYATQPCRGAAAVLVVCVGEAKTLLRLNTEMDLVLDATFSGCGQTVITIAASWCDIWNASSGALVKSIDMGEQIMYLAWGRDDERDDMQRIRDREES